MKFTYVLAAAGLASAQNLAGIPACATGCLSSAIAGVGCPPNDAGCQCGPSKAAIGASVAPCLIRSCQANDLASAASVGEALCVQYSATAGSGSSSASSTTGAPTATTTTSSTSRAGSSGITTTSAPTFQTTPPQTTTVTNGTTVVGGGGGGGNGTVVNPSPSTTRQPGAGAVASPVMMGFGAVAAVIGAVAAL